MSSYGDLFTLIGEAIDGATGLAWDKASTALEQLASGSRDDWCIVLMQGGQQAGGPPGDDDIGYTEHSFTVESLLSRNPVTTTNTMVAALDRVTLIRNTLCQRGVVTTANAAPPEYVGYSVDADRFDDFLAVVVEFTCFHPDSWGA